MADFTGWDTQQPSPPRPEPGSPGFLQSALGVGLAVLEPVAWTLDLLGRPVRTFLGTGDLERAYEAIGDPSKALYGRDLLDSIGIGTIGYADGKFDWGDIPDFLLETGVEMATDPLTWTGIGAVTRVGAKTAKVGKTALRALSGVADADIPELVTASKRALEIAKKMKKPDEQASTYALEMADNVAGWINGQAAKEGLKIRAKTLSDVMPDWAEVQQIIDASYPHDAGRILGAFDEGIADDLARLAAAKLEVKTGLQEQLTHFGLGKTWAQQMRNGERSILGMTTELNPFTAAFKPANVPLFGTGNDFGVRAAEWVSDNAGIIGAAASAMPWGARVARTAEKTKEFLFNPRAETAMEELIRSAGGVPAIELRHLTGEVDKYKKVLDDSGLQPMGRQLIDAAIGTTELKEKALGEISDWAVKGGRDVKQVMRSVAELSERYVDITTRTLMWDFEHDNSVKALGEMQRGLLAELKGLQDAYKSRSAEVVNATEAYNRALRERELAADRIVADTHDIKLAEWDKYNKVAAGAEKINAARTIRKAALTKLDGVSGMDAARRARIVTGMDAVAKAWADATGNEAAEWYVRVGAQLQPDEMLRFERGGKDAPSVHTLLRGLSTEDKLALGLPNGRTLAELYSAKAPQEMLQKAARIEVEIEAAIKQQREAIATGGSPPADPVIDKLRNQMDAVQTGASPVGIGKKVKLPPKPGYFKTTLLGERILSRGSEKGNLKGGVLDPHMLSLEEFTEQVKKLGEGVDPDVDAIGRAHRRAISQAIDHGFFVPKKAFDGHVGHAKAFGEGGTLQTLNTANIAKSKDLLSANEFATKLKLEKEAQKKLVEQQGKLADQAYAASLDKVYNRYQTEVIDKLPGYARVMFTPEAATLTVNSEIKGKLNLNSSSISRKFLDTGGLPLTPGQLNDILKNEPDRIHRLIAAGGRMPEGTPGMMATLNAAYRPDEATFIAIAKQMTGKANPDAAAIQAARDLPVNERLQFFKQSFAKVFDERPDVLLAANLESVSRKVTNKEFKNGMARLFAKPLGKVAENQASLDMLAEIRKMEDLIDEGKAPKGARETLEKLKDQYAHSGGDAVDAGWVRAGGLGPELEGMQIKASVYREAQKYMSSRVWAANIRDAVPALTSFVRTWKIGQLAAPGSVIRNVIGDVSLMMQNGMFDPTVMANPLMQKKIFDLMRSEGDAEKLKLVGDFLLGGRRISAEEMYKGMSREGIFSLSDIQQEMLPTLTGRMQRNNAVSKTIGKASDWWGNVNNFQRGVSRANGFIARLKAGDTMEVAASAVNAALYDYSRVSPAVEFLRTTGVIPFATWMSKNIPAQLEILLTRPGQFAAMIHAKNSIEQGVPGVAEQDLPAYVKDKFNLVMSRDEKGKVLFTTLSNVIPMADLWEVEGDPFGLFVNALGPVPKYVIEKATNRNLFTRQEIQKIDDEFDLLLPGTADVKVPVWGAHLVRTAVGRPLNLLESVGEVVAGQIDPKTGEPKGWTSKGGIASWATGISLRESSAMANLIDEVAEMEREIRDTKAAASRWGRKGYPNLEQELLQKVHVLEEKMATGRYKTGRQELRKQQQERRRETQRRQAGYPQ